jgi:hypothetical protein
LREASWFSNAALSQTDGGVLVRDPAQNGVMLTTEDGYCARPYRTLA